jgi:protein-S-isoprenylcysteine O-methyltransferase Ste14
VSSVAKKIMKNSPYLTLILVWFIFGVVHSLLASGIMKRVMMKIMGNGIKYYRAIYSLIVTATLIVLIHYHFAAINTIMWRAHWIEKIFAVLLILSGFVVMVICIWKYFLDLSGIGVVLGVERPIVLQETGLHAYVRHPLYTGTIVFIWGVFLGYPYMNNLVSAICLTIYTLIGIYFEEKKLVVEYGEQYKQYQAKVPVLLPLNLFRSKQ